MIILTTFSSLLESIVLFLSLDILISISIKESNLSMYLIDRHVCSVSGIQCKLNNVTVFKELFH